MANISLTDRVNVLYVFTEKPVLLKRNNGLMSGGKIYTAVDRGGKQGNKY